MTIHHQDLTNNHFFAGAVMRSGVFAEAAILPNEAVRLLAFEASGRLAKGVEIDIARDLDEGTVYAIRRVGAGAVRTFVWVDASDNSFVSAQANDADELAALNETIVAARGEPLALVTSL